MTDPKSPAPSTGLGVAATPTPERTARRLPFTDNSEDDFMDVLKGAASPGTYFHTTAQCATPAQSTRSKTRLTPAPPTPCEFAEAVSPRRCLSDAITPSAVFGSPVSGSFRYRRPLRMSDFNMDFDLDDMDLSGKRMAAAAPAEPEAPSSRRRLLEAEPPLPSPPTTSKPKRCRCKKSQCLKQYCECFKVGNLCKDCDCTDCFNDGKHEPERQEAMQKLNIQPQPRGFKKEVENRGCRCVKSNCQKRYCECFDNNLKCSSKCRCRDCKNTGPHSHSFPDGAPQSVSAAANQLVAKPEVPAAPAPLPPKIDFQGKLSGSVKTEFQGSLSGSAPRSSSSKDNFRSFGLGSPPRSVFSKCFGGTPPRNLGAFSPARLGVASPPPSTPPWAKPGSGCTPSPMPAMISRALSSPFLSPLGNSAFGFHDPATPDIRNWPDYP